MSELAITVDDVDATGRLAGETSRYLSDGLSALGREIDDLSSSWRGQAADTYAAAWAEVRAGAQEVLLALGALGESLTVVASSTSSTDTVAAQSISSLQGIA